MSGRSPDELVRLLYDSLERAGQEREPPSYEQLEAYVDGRLDDVDREIVETWLADDADLRAEVDSLRDLRTELGAASDAPRVVPFVAPPAARAGEVARLRGARWWPIAAAAGIAAVVLIAQLMWRAAVPAPSTVAGGGPPAPPAPAPPATPPASALTGPSIRDRGVVIGLTADGTLAGLDGMSAAVRDAVAATLRDGRLPAAASAAALSGRTGVLMADDPARTAFTAIGPRGTAVATARPTFRWTALAGATAYRVRVVDETLTTVAESEASTATTWQPRAALPRGRVLSWQVEAETPDGRQATPAPPQPEAKLLVLSAAEADRAIAALASAPSDLAAAVLAAQAGLYDEADAALGRLAPANAAAPIVERLRRDLAARRGGR